MPELPVSKEQILKYGREYEKLDKKCPECGRGEAGISLSTYVVWNVLRERYY